MDLVIMAAGMGSRYGGLKQIDPVGPNGEIILDYSVYDAVKAGFDKFSDSIKKSCLEKEKNKWKYYGDSIDVAFLALSQKLETDKVKYKIYFISK